MGQELLRRLPDDIGRVVGHRPLGAAGDQGGKAPSPQLEDGGEQIHRPDGPHEQGHLAGDGPHQVRRLALGDRQAIELGEMDDHAGVHRQGREQIGDGHRVEGHRHALGDAIVADQDRPHLALGCQDAPADLVAEIAGEEAGVEGRQGLALRLQQFPEARLEGGDVRFRLAEHLGLPALGIHQDDQPFRGHGADADDVPAVDETGGVAAQGGEQQIALLPRIAIDLVEHQDGRSLQGHQDPQGADLGLGEVAVDDEQHQIGAAGDLLGQALPFLPPDLVEARGVDEIDPTAFVLLPAAHLGALGLAVEGTGGEMALAEEGVEGGGLTDADPAENGDVDVALLQLGEHGLHLAVILR